MLGDTLEDNGIHHKRKQIVLNGTEDWELYNNEHIFRMTLNNIKSALCKCTHFIGITEGLIRSNYSCLTNNYGIYINNKDITGIDNWKQYLAEQYANGTPVIVEYDLAEEEIVPYNETQQEQYNNIQKLKSCKDMTIITSTSEELGAILDVEAVQDMNTYKEETQAELESIKSRLALLE